MGKMQNLSSNGLHLAYVNLEKFNKDKRRYTKLNIDIRKYKKI